MTHVCSVRVDLKSTNWFYLAIHYEQYLRFTHLEWIQLSIGVKGWSTI